MGIGAGASGMGHREWGIGNGASGMGDEEDFTQNGRKERAWEWIESVRLLGSTHASRLSSLDPSLSHFPVLAFIF